MRIIFVLAFVFLSGCTTGEKWSNISKGMNKLEVVKVLGSPDGISNKEEYELFSYTNRMTSLFSDDKADYHVLFKDGFVEQYGVTNVRTVYNPNRVSASEAANAASREASSALESSMKASSQAASY